MIALLAMISFASDSYSSHVHGGEFRYTHVSGTTYSIEFHYYTRLSSPADQPELIFNYGDGTLDTVPRQSFQDIIGGMGCYGDLRYSIYQKDHTFPGPGTYVITMDVQNRNNGILNMPNSNVQSFCVSTTLVISSTLGANNSVVFEVPQFNFDPYYHLGANNWFFGHSLDPVDADGDSLSFELVPALGINCQETPGYSLVGAIDPVTGEWQWVATQIGDFNVAIKATEWRNGQMIGQVTRDMSVCVLPIVGLEEVQATALTITPTLTNSRINISSPETLRMTIHSTSGAVIMAKDLPPGEQLVDMTGVADGIYLINLTDANGAYKATRIVKH